jgi:hypothetical protein
MRAYIPVYPCSNHQAEKSLTPPRLLRRVDLTPRRRVREAAPWLSPSACGRRHQPRSPPLRGNQARCRSPTRPKRKAMSIDVAVTELVTSSGRSSTPPWSPRCSRCSSSLPLPRSRRQAVRRTPLRPLTKTTPADRSRSRSGNTRPAGRSVPGAPVPSAPIPSMISTMLSRPTVWTVGHSNHGFGGFAHLVAGQRIEFLVDVRSYPYSRFAPHFNREELEGAMAAHGVGYLFLGEELGGRPTREEHYDADGHALYGLMSEEERFKAAVDRLIRGAHRHRIALVCSEGNPQDCHRRLLVGKVLCDRGVELRHTSFTRTATTACSRRSSTPSPSHRHALTPPTRQRRVGSIRSAQPCSPCSSSSTKSRGSHGSAWSRHWRGTLRRSHAAGT